MRPSRSRYGLWPRSPRRSSSGPGNVSGFVEEPLPGNEALVDAWSKHEKSVETLEDNVGKAKKRLARLRSNDRAPDSSARLREAERNVKMARAAHRTARRIGRQRA